MSPPSRPRKRPAAARAASRAVRYTLATAPATDVVSLEAAKAHLRVDSAGDDALIKSLVAAATAHLDGRAGILGRAIVSQTWRLDVRAPVSGCIPIDMVGVSSIASVKYLAAGVEQTWTASEYRLGARGLRSFVEPGAGFSWPSADDQEDAYRVSFVAGWPEAEVPAPIKAAILLMVGDLYENRETVAVGAAASSIPMIPTVDRLIAPYRIRSF